MSIPAYSIRITYDMHAWRELVKRVDLDNPNGFYPREFESPQLSQYEFDACTIGAVGSALVLCTDGPGFEPLMVQTQYYYYWRV